MYVLQADIYIYIYIYIYNFRFSLLKKNLM